MRIIIVALLLVLSVGANAQRIVPIGGNRTTDTGLIVGSLKVDSVLVFPAYRTTNTNMVLGFDSRGKAVLRINNDSLIYATRRYVDSVAASIESGAVDTVNYIASIARLDREIDSVFDYVDSNNTIFASQIAELDSASITYYDKTAEAILGVTVLDSAVGVAFGAISDLYDTLGNFLLKSDSTNLYTTRGRSQQIADSLGAVIATKGNGTVTSITGGYGLTGGTITSTGTFAVDSTLQATRARVKKQIDSLAALIPSLSGYVPYTGATTDVDLGTHAISARTGVINKPSGSGTALSVTKGGSGEALTVTKTSGSGNAMSVTGGVTQLSELHTTTAIADAYIASAATWNAKYGTNDTGRAATNIVTGGALNKVRDSLAALSGGGSSTIIKANEFNMLYKANGDTTIRGTTKLRVDTTDMRLEFAWDTTTTTVSTDPHGGIKMWGSNRMGMGAVRINDTVSIAAALQRAVNAQTISTMLPSVAATFNLAFTGGFTPVSGQLPAPSGTNAIVASAASSIQHLKLTKTVFTTGSGVNSACSLRVTSLAAYSGLVGGTTKFSRGGGRGTFTFSFPTYASTERIMVGYLSGLTDNFSGEPSAVIAGAGALMLIKESTDTTLFFYHKALNALPAAISKVNTGVVPNNEDVYRLTVYVSPTSTYYMQLEVLSTTGTRTIVINPTTNIQPPSSKFVSYQGVNNGTVSGAVSYGLIQMMEEIY